MGIRGNSSDQGDISSNFVILPKLLRRFNSSKDTFITNFEFTSNIFKFFKAPS